MSTHEELRQLTTRREQALERAVQSLDPDRALDRTYISARFLLGGATVVTALLTAFGGVVVGASTKRAELSLPALLCLATAIGLAAWASVGRAGRVNLEDLEAVARHFDEQIGPRARKVRAAGIAFALAIPLCALPAAAGTDSFARPHLDASLSAGRLTVSADAGHQDSSQRLTVEAVERGRVLAFGRWEAADEGHLSGYLSAQVHAGTAPVSVTATLSDAHEKALGSSSLRLKP